MLVNIVLFGQAGVGKSSVIKLLAGSETAQMSTGPQRRALRSRQYTFALRGKTFNIWDTVGLGEAAFAVSNAIGTIEEMYAFIQQIEQHGGLHLLLYCIRGGSRITQTTLNNYRLFFEVLCDKRIPIAVVVTHLENEERMENWWYRNGEHITRCGLEFIGHACVTGLLQHPQAEQSRAALRSLLLDFALEGNHRTALSSDSVSSFLDRLSIITGPETSKVKSYRSKQVEQLLRNQCMAVSPNKLTRNPTRMLESPPRASRPVSPQLRGGVVTSPRHLSTNWFKTILRLSSPIRDDDIVVFLVGPTRSEKSTFMHAVAPVRGSIDVEPAPRLSTKVQAIRRGLTEEERKALRTEGQRNIVFVDTPSFFTDRKVQMKAAHEMSTWLKRPKSKSICFGTIYLHRIDVGSNTDSPYHIQRHLDTFAGTFPPELAARAFPQRLHCVFSSYSDLRESKILRRQKRFQNELSELRQRVVNGWIPKWETSIHPELFVKGDPDTAWKAVEALFSS